MIQPPVINPIRNCRLLIFEEEQSMQAVLSEAFLPEKFQLEFVSKSLIDSGNFLLPSLVLLDYNSAPNLSEDNFCKKIKTRFPQVPLVVISAYPLNKLNHYQRYIDLFIAKPFDLDDFLNAIESCVVG